MIWITGNKGMLGREVCRTLTAAGVPFTGSDREISILEPQALEDYAREKNPSWILNCSAYTAVDKAESESDAAFALNRDGAANLAALAAKLNIPLIHISTDYVFDGTSTVPLPEEAESGPMGVYGASKLSGEEEIRKTWKKHFIIRTAWLYGEFGPNFVYTMIKLMNGRGSIKVVNDQHGSPTWAKDLAELIKAIIQSNSTDYGTYHFSGEGQCTWYEFAREIYRLGRERELITAQCIVNPCGSEEYPTPAKRPAYSLLSKEKVRRVYSFHVPEWKTSLSKFISETSGII